MYKTPEMTMQKEANTITFFLAKNRWFWGCIWKFMVHMDLKVFFEAVFCLCWRIITATATQSIKSREKKETARYELEVGLNLPHKEIISLEFFNRACSNFHSIKTTQQFSMRFFALNPLNLFLTEQPINRKS